MAMDGKKLEKVEVDCIQVDLKKGLKPLKISNYFCTNHLSPSFLYQKHTLTTKASQTSMSLHHMGTW